MLAACALHAAEYHVAPSGLDSNEGSKSEPFKTISAAAQIAQPGDVITVHEGTYRERVNPPRGGTSDDKRITYQAAPGEKVDVKGSEIVKGWERAGEGVWKVTLPNSFFGDFNPYSDVIKGEWHKDKGYPRHTGTVYLNGTWMDEESRLERVLAPIGKHPYWIAKVDENTTTIWAQFKEIDPNKELVEINVRQSVFYPDKPGRNYITVRGFTMCQAATPWSGAMSEQIGLIGTHWSKGWIIENNVISHSMNTGITLGRYDLTELGVDMPEATAPGFVESCELAIEHGWSKERIGSHVVRNNHISHCEKNGIHGSLGGVFSTIEGNTIHDIAVKDWIGGADVAGLKLLASNDVIIRGNHIYRCRGYGGVWLDWMAQGTRFTGNLLHDNSKDLFMEVNHGPFLIDHNLFLSSKAIRDWSQGSAYAHNLIAGSISSKPEKRVTPYFKPHATEDMKFSSIEHKDTRYYNNLLLGKSSLPSGNMARNLQAAGNACLQDASIKLEEQGNGLWLRIPQVPAAETCSLVTTELLGKAKIPDASFENPDGAPYRLDADYFGRKRIPENPAPGPFATQDDKESRLKVWPKTQVTPNIVVFFLDDSGYGDYAHNGNPTIRTPNISKLAQDGINFTQFYVTSPACSASRYSLLTGRYPGRSGLGSWVIGPGAQRHIHPNEITLAEGLRTRGYRTGIFGKWHLGNPNQRNGVSRDTLPLAHGFDEWLGTNVSHDYGNAMLLKSDSTGTDPIKGYSVITKNLPSKHDICASLTGRSTEAAIAFIERNKANPFFAYIPFNMPHLGIHASDKFLGKSRRGLLGDVMEEIDYSVGRIRKTIEEAGLTENTLIVFSSDNGPWIRFQDTASHPKYGEARLHVGYAQPFRDGKGSTWEGGHRVPGIFCWPGTIPANSVELSPVSTLDILPTVFALAGVDLPKGRTIDGRDIRPYLMPQVHKANVPEFEFYYSWADNKPSAVRVGPWKMHTRIASQTGNNYGFKASRDTPLLFQVEQDLGERIDRAGEQANLVEQMMEKLTAFESQVQDEGTFWEAQ